MQKADKEQKFPDFMYDRARQMSELTGRECSTFKQHLLTQEIIFTSDPTNVQALLATKFNDFELGPARRGNMMVTLGDGIFVQDGKSWEHSRAMLRPNFIRDQVSDLDLEERHVQDLFRVLPPVDKAGWTSEVDIQTLFFRLTIDSACEFLFGESVDSQLREAGLLPKTATTVDFATHFDRALLHLARRFRLGDQYWLHNPKEFRDE
jgi:cytochrome P450